MSFLCNILTYDGFLPILAKCLSNMNLFNCLIRSQALFSLFYKASLIGRKNERTEATILLIRLSSYACEKFSTSFGVVVIDFGVKEYDYLRCIEPVWGLLRQYCAQISRFFIYKFLPSESWEWQQTSTKYFDQLQLTLIN